MARGPTLIQVTDSVVCVHRPEFLSCSYAVRTASGAVLIDAGIDPTGEDMAQGLGRLDRSIPDVEAILLTHWHNDHSAGAPAIQSASGARAYYHPAGADRFLRVQPPSAWRLMLSRRLPERGLLSGLKGMLEVGPPAPVTLTDPALEGAVLEGAFRVIETPGHELGHVSYLYEPEHVLFSGDALAVSKRRVSFMSRYLTQDLAAARASMLKCLEQEVGAICPGHRYPLLGVTPAVREQAVRRVEAARTWPIYGC